MISESASAAAADAPPAASPDADSRDSSVAALRRVATLAEYQECVAIQEEVWGDGFGERVPATILMVAQKLGGVVAAAFAPDDRILGFVFGLTGLRDGRLAHWSDMLAVRPDARGAGLGERLKRYQRELVRDAGVGTMYWTFDPLVARNAHLNLTRLGARVAEYVPNMYGENTGSPLHGAIATDRLVARWDLDAAAPRAPAPPAGPVVNPVGDDGLPTFVAPPDAPAVRIAVPRDVHALSTDARATWRAVTRAAFAHYLARDLSVVGFHRDGATLPCYQLARP